MSGVDNPQAQEVVVVEPELKDLYEAAAAKKHEELALEHARLLYILENVVPDLRDWILGIGRKLRVVKRDWNAYVGTLVGFSADITHVKLDVTELITQWDKPVDRLERKIVELPAGSIVLWEWIEHEEEVQKPQKQG
jgi:hypothetical protein